MARSVIPKYTIVFSYGKCSSDNTQLCGPTFASLHKKQMHTFA